MLRGVVMVSVLLLIAACSPKLKIRSATPDDVEILPRSMTVRDKLTTCYNPMSYVAHPELLRIKYIRVNLHFMNSTDGRYNMPESEVDSFAREWIKGSNELLASNEKMLLPRGNDTPVLPIPYRYVITPNPDVPGDDGIYYHIDDELCYAVKTGRERNISDKRVIQKYAVRADSVLNIFVQTHQLDSMESKTYRPDHSGISLGTSVKIFGRWNNSPGPWIGGKITNHEIAHSLGLSHTWGGHDGCDDTPAHPNCWYKSDTSPCDSLYSNNMMDYNAFMVALTPCQIGKVIMNMTRLASMQRNLLEPRWCVFDSAATMTIRDSVRWEGSVDLEGNILILQGAILEIGCRVSLPKDASIKIAPGGRLVVLSNGILHNSCNEQWGGIELEQQGKQTGKLSVMEGGVIENTPHPLVIQP